MNTHVSLALPPQPVAEALGVLATIFGAPLEADDIAALQRPLAEGPLAPLAPFGPLADAVKALHSAALGLGEAQAAVSPLNRDFCLLFLGVAGARTVAPYESAYCGTGRLYQEPASEMARLLAAHGLQMADAFRDAPDHLVVELSLLEEALHRRAEGAASAKALQDRLGGWVPAFAENCRAQDRTGFYAAAAALTAALISHPINLSGQGARA